ncbi:uncharacterized protein LOC127285606 [Leptopilina boulardi]|uniref:uncharacterized protein LOC127285606 n=1 Tax=Leptopilina boulardi TaxID=63433 RepID=UPI0021F5B6A2|nr:uncharacterized protein LOC127285606 [Leptopilina boulardi]
MPSCPPTCSKVKRDLKKLAAEQKKAQKGRSGPAPEKSTDLEVEINNYEYSVDDTLSKSARSGKSYKSTEIKSLCSRSGRSLKNKGSDFEESDFEKSDDDDNENNDDKESRDRRCDRRQCFQVEENLPRTKRRDRRRNREEYESDESEDYISSSHKPCSSECSSKKLKGETIKRRQKEPDDYRPNKGIFDDLCNCSSLCLVKQLWAETHIRKFIVSVALLGVGIKLCYDLDGFQIPDKLSR